MSRPVLILAGPTGSGKSRLALTLAERLDGVVINADSMQVYRALPILTAQPDAEALRRAPHRLYGVLAPSEICSAGRWRRLALAEIAAAHGASKLPIVTGGTGLYLKALIEGLAEVPEIPAPVRTAARRLHDRLGGAAFHAELARRDPAGAARLSPSDRQRLLRAWEVLEATGRPLGAWQSGAPQAAPEGLRFGAIRLDPPRAALYAACEWRFDAMMTSGALEEAKALLALGLDPALPIMKAVGVPELARALTGTLSLDAAVAAAKRATRRYAKRQLTWFRHQALAKDTWVTQLSESFDTEIFNFIRRFLLTKPAPSV